MFAEWFSILCDHFLRSFGPVDRADALGLYQMEPSLQEAVEMITIAKEATLDELRDLTDRQRDLAESMPSLEQWMFPPSVYELCPGGIYS